jgi:hypothetical protein
MSGVIQTTHTKPGGRQLAIMGNYLHWLKTNVPAILLYIETIAGNGDDASRRANIVNAVAELGLVGDADDAQALINGMYEFDNKIGAIQMADIVRFYQGAVQP